MKLLYQSTLNQHVPAVSSTKKALLDRKFVLALYTTGKPFSTFEDPTWVDLRGLAMSLLPVNR
jgi:hypothetical protein